MTSPVCLVKAGDTTRTSDATPSDDPDLTFSVTAGKWYAIECCVLWTSPATPDFKFQPFCTGTIGEATGELVYCDQRVISNASYTALARPIHTGTIDGSMTLSLAGSATSTHRGIVWMRGIFRCIASGTFSIRWSQGTSTASSTIVKAGSYLYYEPIP